MASDPTLPTLTALVAALRANPGVAAIVSDRTFDASPPQETPYPFISIGAWTITDYGEKDVAGNDTTVTIHCWSRANAKGAMQLAAAVYSALHERDLSIAGFQAVLVRHASTSYVVDPDGKTHHAAAAYRIITTTPSNP